MSHFSLSEVERRRLLLSRLVAPMDFYRKFKSFPFLRQTVLALILVCVPALLQAQSVWQGELSPSFFGITSSTTFYNLADVTGAMTFYENGIAGQNTTSWVVDAQLVGTSLFPAENFTNVSGTYATSDVVTDPGMHATFCAALLGGNTVTGGTNYYLNNGLAYGTTLGTAAIATGTYSDGSFDFSTKSLSAYTYAASHGDVLSTSIGDSSDTAGVGILSGLLDSLAVTNSHTTIVAAAGNDGPTGAVGGPASGYNVISVGALDGETGYTTVASFSSVGPLQTAWYDGTNTYYYDNGAATRPGVDLVAPGSDIAIPATMTVGSDSIDFSYYSVEGTSFATPLVAAGASLLVSTAKTAFTNLDPSVQSAATQSLVIKAVLMNSATKLAGWDNGQHLVNGVITTNQALDYTMGAGAMNLSKAFTQYTTSAYVTTDSSVAYTGFNLQVEKIGWGYGTALLGGTNTYTFSDQLTAGEQLAVTLTWFRNRTWDSTVEDYLDVKQAELDLYIYMLIGDARQLVAESISPVSTTQELYFMLQETGNYLIEVVYSTDLFNNGDPSGTQDYGIAWDVEDVPEPGTYLLFALGTVFLLFFRRNPRTKDTRVFSDVYLLRR